ncbi:MAG: glycosyltransferase family 9 protein, partial [Rhodospirillaceae bacterium]
MSIPPPRFRQAALFLDAGMLEAARDTLGPLRPEDPGDPLFSLWCRLMARSERDPLLAIAQLRAAEDQGDPDLLNDLALRLIERGQESAAQSLLDRLLNLAPDHGPARHNRGRMGLARLETGDGSGLESVLDDLQQAAVALPDQADIWADLGHAHKLAGNFTAALEVLDRATGVAPDRADLWDALGGAALAADAPIQAVMAFEKAVGCAPDRVESWANLAAARIELRDLAGADQACESALSLAPEDPGSRVNRAFVDCLRGQYGRGLVDYAWRWQTAEFQQSYAPVAAPCWTGDGPVPGPPEHPLLIRFEQGFGDQIMAVRFVGPLLDRLATQDPDRRVILECHPALHRLFAASLPLDPDRLILLPMGPPPPPVAAWIGALDLARPLGLDDRCLVPGPMPCLSPPEDRLPEALQTFLDQGPAVGVAWVGKPKPKNRSCPAEMLIPALLAAGLRVVSLQTGPPAAALNPAWDRTGEALFDAGPLLQDFASTAAVMARLSAVVSVDTAVAHLAGALGRPVSILLVEAPDWRWGAVGDRCAWYPTARLYRRPERNQAA